MELLLRCLSIYFHLKGIRRNQVKLYASWLHFGTEVASINCVFLQSQLLSAFCSNVSPYKTCAEKMKRLNLQEHFAIYPHHQFLKKNEVGNCYSLFWETQRSPHPLPIGVVFVRIRLLRVVDPPDIRSSFVVKGKSFWVINVSSRNVSEPLSMR